MEQLCPHYAWIYSASLLQRYSLLNTTAKYHYLLLLTITSLGLGLGTSVLVTSLLLLHVTSV